MRSVTRFILSITLLPTLTITCATATEADPPSALKSSKLLEERQELDSTVWADEIEGQNYEAVFIDLWDRILAADPANKIDELISFPFKSEIRIPEPPPAEPLDLSVHLTRFQENPCRTFSPAEWKTFTQSLKESGIEIVQTEWHHSRFIPAGATNAPQSTISFALHALREATHTRFAVKGDLIIQWAASEAAGADADPVADSIKVSKLTLQERSDDRLFRNKYTLAHGPEDFMEAHPVLVYDLNSDGHSEIIIPRWNNVWWNRGDWNFDQGYLLKHPKKFMEAGIFSDFNGDGNADFVTVGKDGKPYFYAGTETGSFPDEPEMCAKVHFDLPTAVTAGDVDGDGDLDLWMTQYKVTFKGGQMPTPYYDANDGPPSYFLINDGSGTFKDATESAGLSRLRNRRTYSASFVDLDQDGDLDLLNVSDFAGIDIYRNDGKGAFELDTDAFVKNRHFFGMGHTFGDYNNDGLMDFYVIGMSSTTARRLDRLGLGRDDRPDIHPMRAAMGYGNRMYFGTEDGRFREDPAVAPSVARTGWSWGTSSFDFDLDGDQDVYVANGHRSGKSCEDYCTTFWRHDIYTGGSEENPEILKVFQTTLSDLQQDELSWNGYEKNVFLVNHANRPERFINNAFAFDMAYAFDARSVVSDDLDGDGRPDLLVAKYLWNDIGAATQIKLIANEIATEPAGKFLAVRLRESPGAGYSPNGAKVTIVDNLGNKQTRWIVTGDSYLAQHAAVAHFGLGEADHVESIEVSWPNGPSKQYEDLSLVNTSVSIRGDGPLTQQGTSSK